MAVASYMQAPSVKTPKTRATPPPAPVGANRTNGQNTYQGTPMGQAPSTMSITGNRGAQPGGWTPPQIQPTPTQPGSQAVHGGGAGNFFQGGHGQIWNQDAFKSNDSPVANYISSVLPVAQFDQNNYQYAQDFNEAQRRWNQETGMTQQNNQFQQGLSGRQQQMAEWQAQEAANQFNQQFDWTKQTDQWNKDFTQQGLNNQGREIDNTGRYQQGLVSNQGNLNNYQNQYWQGQNANQQYANQSTAQYQQGLLGNMSGELNLANRTQDQNNAFLYSQMAQQAQQQQAERENMMRMTAMQTYGRSQAPSTKWRNSWG